MWCWINENGDGLVAVFTALLFAVTAGLVWYTARLWGANKELIKSSEESSKRQLRAYVCMADLNIIDHKVHPVAENNKVLVIRVRNLGKTPAYAVRLYAGSSVHRPVVSIDTTGTELPYLRNPEMIFPGKSYQHLAILSTDFLNAAFEGTPIYAYGCIDYTDAFEHKWRTLFSYKLNSDTDRWEPDTENNCEKDLGPTSKELTN